MTDPAPSQVPGVVGVEVPTASTPAAPTPVAVKSGGNMTTANVQPKTSLITTVVGYLSSGPFLHVAGLAALSVLTGVGVVPVNEGLPLIVGAVGLGINAKTA